MNADSLDQLSKGKTTEIRRLRAFRKDGSVFWLRVVASLHQQSDDVFVCYSTLIDITENVEKEQRAEWQAERYRLLSEASNVITFDYDPVTDALEYSISKPDKGVINCHVDGMVANLPQDKKMADESKEGYCKALKAACETPEEGTYDYQADLFGTGFRWYRVHYISVADENGLVFRIVGRVDDIEQMVLEQNEMRRRAQTDGLTGLINKQAGQEMIEYTLRQRQPRRTDAMILLDIDNFKAINDTYGHIEGDRVLQVVGRTISGIFRSNDIVVRFGGDEFIIYLRSIGDQELVAFKADNIARELETIVAGGDKTLSCSMGIVLINDENVGFEEVFNRADYALYVSKRGGRNRYTVYDPETMGTQISLIGQWRET